MRRTLHTLMLALPLSITVACDLPEDEAALEALEALDQEAELQDAEDQGPMEGAFDLTSNNSTAWKCHCWTTCSSNGKGWTKSYFVGSYGTKASCDNHAKSFCKGKASDYKYANSGCGAHP